MIDGVTIRMGGEDFIVPPLNFKQLKQIRPVLQSLNDPSISQDDKEASIVKCVTMALSRNYPEMTEDRIFELVDIGNSGKVMAAIMGNSGIKEGVPGEASPVIR